MRSKLNIFSRINLIAMSFLLLVANSASMAAPVSASLEFTCPFPFIGDRVIIANVSADYPEAIVVESTSMFAVSVEAVTVVPDKARLGLDFAGATTVTGVAHSVNTFHTEGGEIPHNIDLQLQSTEVPANETGPFDVYASGVSTLPSFGLSHVGSVKLTVDSLVLDLKNLRADGSVATKPVGEFSIDCALNAGQDNVLAQIEVTSTLIDAEIDVEQEVIDFGAHLLGQPAEQTVMIRNVGGAILGVNAISISGIDAQAFSETNSCTSVEPGEHCAVQISYTASQERVQSASLVINSTDADKPVVSVVLRGVGLFDERPDINVSVEQINFGTIEENVSATHTILITNIGTGPLLVSDVGVNNIQGAEFSVTENCLDIVSGGTCLEVVTFESVDGVSTGNVVISSNDEDTPVMQISLMGAGEVISVDPCDLEPALPECGSTSGADLIMPIELGVAGSTYIAKNRSTVPLLGVVQSEFNLTQGLFAGNLNLATTQGSFEIIQGWKRYQATALIEFEPVGKTVGTVVDGVLVATAQAYVKLPKVTKSLFGLVDWRVGGGNECGTISPVTFTITSVDGEFFDPLVGGGVIGEYTMPKLEKCGLLTSILSSKLAGSGNRISLSLVSSM